MFPKSVFYGRQREKSFVLQAKLARREKEIKENKIPAPYKSSITGPSTAWKVFFKQSEAFKFAKMFGEDMWVFSFESDIFFEQKGQRMYLTTSLDKFWHYYRQLDGHSRHHYEIIPEGSVCHLYFDLEFYKTLNEACDGPAMTAVFIKCICQGLRRMFKVNCDVGNVLQLHASTDAKYSCHLVFRLKNAAFHDNISAGNFVHKLCAKIQSTVRESNDKSVEPNDKGNHASLASEPDSGATEYKRRKLATTDATETLDDRFLKEASVSHEDLESLFVVDKNGGRNIFCDLGVYTKNRNFRLYLSCKKGKNNPLVLSPSNTYVPEKVLHEKDLTLEDREKAYFLDSLISFVRFCPTLKILHCENDGAKACSGHSKSVSSGCKNDCMEGEKSSPYTEVDLYLKDHLQNRGHGGYLRRWAYFHQMEKIIYDVGGDRWCENIQRQHKSNNIMFVVDLRSGTFCQKCHDPDCRRNNFRSQDWQLPPHVLPAFILADDPWNEKDDDGDFELTDEQLLQVEADMLHKMEGYDGQQHNMQPEQSRDAVTQNPRIMEDSDDLDDVTDEQLLQLSSQMDS